MAFLALTAGQTDADSPLDQTLFDLIRTNFDDHETRFGATESLSEGSIRDDFVYPTGGINTDVWDVSGTNVYTDNQPNHLLHFNHGSGQYSAVAASDKKMRFDLDKKHTVVMELRHISTQSDNTEAWMFGFQDAALTTSTSAIVTDQSDFIGFAQGSTANTYKAITSKGGVGATLQDNIGNAAVFSKLKIVVTFSDTVALQVQMFVDGTEVSGSPYTDTAKIPLLSMRPAMGTAGGGSVRDSNIDYCLAYWSARPLSV